MIKMFVYYVYILECSDDSFYTGITNNLDKRIQEHQSGYMRNSYTYKRRPVALRFCQEFNDVLQAISFEKKIKGWGKAKKQALVDGDCNMLQILSECRNVTHYKYNPKQ